MKTGAKKNTGVVGSEGQNSSGRSLLWTALLLAGLLSVLFIQSYNPSQVLFSNDGPYGGMVAEFNRMPGIITGVWRDINWLGNEELSPSPGITSLLRWVTCFDPLVYSNFLAPVSLLVVGLGACFCLKRFKLTPLACVLGGLAAGLNSDFFSTSCWGVASQTVGFGAMYVAVGLLAGEGKLRQWMRVVLAGLAVGIGIMEAYDIGAIFSLFVAAYALYRTVFLNENGNGKGKLGLGLVRVAVVAGFAAYIATHSLTTLIGTQLKGVVGTQQDTNSKQRMWPAATEWSLPKVETLQVIVPGLFGYRNQWHMYDSDQPREDQYWGTIGADPRIDMAAEQLRDGDADKRNAAAEFLKNSGLMWRLIGTGFYAGISVALVALWAVFQSFRKEESFFTPLQRRAIWFWLGVVIVSLLLSFGKYAPFYQLFYALPYASAIRNPDKFMHVFHWALIILFGYGVHGLASAYLKNPVPRVKGLLSQFSPLGTGSTAFQQKWLFGCLMAVGASLLGWLLYFQNSPKLQAHIQSVGLSADDAVGVATFSIHAVGWYILFLILTVGLFALIFGGRFSGERARWGGFLLGALMVIDLSRADIPWIVYQDIPYKYASDDIIKFLSEKPYEHRVALLPVPYKNQQFDLLQSAYGSYWKQHLFFYNNIQCADVVQEPRVAEDKDMFARSIPLVRFWELSNTRYLLGPGGDFMKQMDPSGRQFRILKSFNFVPRKNNPTSMVDFAAQADPNGQLAVIEFTSALPRAKLFPNWQVSNNDSNTLQTLANPMFDPHQTVLISDSSLSAPLEANIKSDPGTVTMNPNYKSKRNELTADVKVPSVLWLSERYNPKWVVEVDGKPAPLLRCDFIMRGVFLQPGKHTVVFRFAPPLTTLYVSLSAIVVGLLLCGWLTFTKDEEPKEETADAELPDPKNKANN